MTVKATSAITSIQRNAGLNSMQSKTRTRSSNSTMFARCRSPWHSRTKPRRSRSSIAVAIRRCVACVHRSSAAIRAATPGACSSRRTCSKLAAAFASAVAADPQGSAGLAHGTSAWKRAMHRASSSMRPAGSASAASSRSSSCARSKRRMRTAYSMQSPVPSMRGASGVPVTVATPR